MSDGLILVTGAAGGQQGSTGNWLARFLLERVVYLESADKADRPASSRPSVVKKENFS